MQIVCSCAILSMLVLNIWCKGQKKNDWSITFNPQTVTAVPGVCALISCTFSRTVKPDNIQWRKCDKSDNCKEIFRGETDYQKRLIEGDPKKPLIEILEPDLTQNNCSIIVKNIKAEDEMEYELEWSEYYTTSKSRVQIIIQDKPTMKVPDLSEGVQASLTCSAPLPCPETPPEITWWIRIRAGNYINAKAYDITLNTSKSFYLSTLTLTPTSDLHNAIVRCDVNYGKKSISTRKTLEVFYVQALRIQGNDKVKAGDTLSLNCTVESHPPSADPVWTFYGTSDQLKNHTFGESLTITRVGQERAGVYRCEMTYMNKTLNASVFIDITGATKEDSLKTPTGESMQRDFKTTVADFFRNLDILSFVVGIACSALIFSAILCCCLCFHRSKKRKVPTANPDGDDNLEMVQVDVVQTRANEQTPLHGQLEGETPNTAAPTDAAEESEAVGTEAREADYASIDYSLLKNRPPEEKEMETTNTDYAEIKKDRRGERKERETLQDGDDQIETPCQKQVEGEEELYSNSQVLKRQETKESSDHVCRKFNA